MSEAEEYYVDAIRKRFIDALSDPDPHDDIAVAARKVYLAAVEQALRDGLAMEIAQRDVVRFIERLLTRQGTHMADFDGVYEKKAQLDRKLGG